MIYRFERVVRATRKWLSRGDWVARLLGMPVSPAGGAAPGLVLIQIDGLSYNEIQAALARGEMKFLARLLRHETYRLHWFYSGLPSSTPAVQAELFYGVANAVPAFSFMDRQSKNIVSMVDMSAAVAVERSLESQGRPLLRGGSAYSNIFTGGAAEAHFCASSFGWNSVLRAANPAVRLVAGLAHSFSFVRVTGLLIVEFGLAIVDFFRGMIAGHDLLSELKFVPARVGICILLREFVTIGAMVDVARGLPIIHLNYLGYDEQAHRRGPSSRFAHWTLKGIDRAVAQVWRAAHRSTRRHYDVWIYADHGQQATDPYPSLYNQTIKAAVDKALDAVAREPVAVAPRDQRGIQSQRVRYLGGARVQKLTPTYREPVPIAVPAPPVVVALGPVGLVYLDGDVTAAARERLATYLVEDAMAPLVLAVTGDGGVLAWTANGKYDLIEDRAQVLGADHPFLDEVARDLANLCRHPNAGDLVICGWRAGARALSFPFENGAHAGPGPDETGAFALLPDDTALPERPRDYLRPVDLREAALRFLDRAESKAPTRAPTRAASTRTLRVMTYNVHSCVGMDGRLSPERVARVIGQYRPDVVALQELDVGRPRTGGVDQAHLIARHLEMAYQFHPTVHIEEERYGNAVLSHLPLRLVKAEKLPGLDHMPRLQPRGALWVAIEMAGTEIQVINTHLGLLANERLRQTKALLGGELLGHPDCRGPVVLCGDFNALPSGRVCRQLRGRLRDAQGALVGRRPRNTFFGRYPAARIDYVFVDDAAEVLNVEVPRTERARAASDHLPLIVDIEIPA